MAYLWSQAFSLNEIIHELKISNKTAIEWCTFFRECCINRIIDNSTPIGGNGIEVEIDESKFGKQKYYRGHHVEGQWVFGGREKYDKRKIFMIPVTNRKQKTLLPLIKKWIKPGSIIHSDFWKGYCNLNKMGYTHVTVNHSKYKARHAHKRLYTVLPKYSKIQVLPGITSCRLVKDNKQAIELNSLLINNMPEGGYEWN